MLLIGQIYYIENNNWLNFKKFERIGPEKSVPRKTTFGRKNSHHTLTNWVVQRLIGMYRYNCICSFNKIPQFVDSSDWRKVTSQSIGRNFYLYLGSGRAETVTYAGRVGPGLEKSGPCRSQTWVCGECHSWRSFKGILARVYTSFKVNHKEKSERLHSKKLCSMLHQKEAVICWLQKFVINCTYGELHQKMVKSSDKSAKMCVT